jgi:PHD/YefM family antitoxin component YafN of YafNO toxin-antitoxin module
MSGINFVIDEKGRKTAVVIDLKEYAQIWEDFYDTFLVRLRKHEPRESLESVKRRLKAKQTAHA